jgi:hypothetical protein
MLCSQWSSTRGVNATDISGRGPTARLSEVVDADCFGPPWIRGTCTLLISQMLAVVHKERRLHTRLLRITNFNDDRQVQSFCDFTFTLHWFPFIGTITILIGGAVEASGVYQLRAYSRSRFVGTKYDQMEIS